MVTTAAALSSRAVRGMFYEALDAKTVMPWVDAISNYFNSDQNSEEYDWLAMAPALGEWAGPRNVTELTSKGLTIRNVKYQAAVKIKEVDWRLDKTGQVRLRVGELVQRSQTHWLSLLTDLITSGTGVPAYDGYNFFAGTHAEGSSGNYSNLLTVSDYSELNVATAANPTAVELASVFMKLVQHFMGFKDDKGEPRNESANAFVVMVPNNMYGAAVTAIRKELLNAGTGTIQNPVYDNGAFKLEAYANSRLTATDAIYMFRADAASKAFIRQEQEAPVFEVLGQGSDYMFMNDAYLAGVKVIRGAGYGHPWQAIKATLS